MALDDLLVVDLTNELGVYATKMLGDMGAVVVRVEPLDGDPMRRRGPFLGGVAGPNRSLPFLHFNTNKLSLALDLHDPTARPVLNRLLGKADLVVDCFSPAEAAALGLDSESINALNDDVIHVSITGFGQKGLHGNWVATDLIGQAMGGLLVLSGFPDDSPVQLPWFQAYHLASLHGAVGAMAAVVRRDISGSGSDIDISMQDAVAMATLQTANENQWILQRVRPLRLGTGSPARVFDVDGRQSSDRRVVWPCADGWVGFGVRPIDLDDLSAWLDQLNAEAGTPTNLVELLKGADEKHLSPHINSCFSKQSAQHLYHTGQARGLLCVPVNKTSDLFNDAQLKARQFLQELPHAETGLTVTYPGAPYQLSRTPWRLRSQAPDIGEHTLQILTERVGLSSDEAKGLITRGVIRDGKTEGHR